jgi:hypothetical protein
MALTAAEANALLANVTTADELRALIAQVDISASGSTTVLYSGGVPGGEAAIDVVRSMWDQGADVRIIDNTEAAKFLDYDGNPTLADKLEQIFDSHPADRGAAANRFLFGTYDAAGVDLLEK